MWMSVLSQKYIQKWFLKFFAFFSLPKKHVFFVIFSQNGIFGQKWTTPSRSL